ncbi:MAG: hypothetical protein NC429_17290 [Lachnospiraceae bacterium]|nr:hypothetical protein [Lachnospiraceae bacterium]
MCIVCVEGSKAEAYAIENGIRYELTEPRKKPQSITASDFTKMVGDKPFLIHAESNGDGVLTYRSNNESVAEVSEEGIVVIHGAGTAKITITASETDLYRTVQKVITVTVNPASGSETGGDGQNPGGGGNTGTDGDGQNSDGIEKPDNGEAPAAVPTVRQP